MSDYVSFAGRIEAIVWGRSTYTILILPDEVLAALGKTRRVEGEINEHPVNLALTRAPVVEGTFLWAGQSLLDRIGAMPGEEVEVRLRPAPDGMVEVPPEVEVAVRAGGVLAVWEGLTPGKQRGLLYQISAAKTEPTRRKRIATLIASLAGLDRT